MRPEIGDLILLLVWKNRKEPDSSRIRCIGIITKIESDGLDDFFYHVHWSGDFKNATMVPSNRWHHDDFIREYQAGRLILKGKNNEEKELSSW